VKNNITKFSVYEAPLVEKKVVFTFGRFNPPTTGHEKLIDKVKSVAGSDDYRIYPSQSQNQKKDPLPYSKKIAYMRKMFPKHKRSIAVDKNPKTAIDVATSLYNSGYRDVTMVVGSDRVKEFETLLKKYNGVKARHGMYKFDNIKVVSAGDRDPDAEGVSGMSASKMRQAATDGNMNAFMDGLPKGFRDGKQLYRDVRKNMGIREEKDMGTMSDYESKRDAYLTGKIWNIGDIIEAKDMTGPIVQRGTNYVSMEVNNKIHRVWLHDIEEGSSAFAPSVFNKDLGRVAKDQDKTYNKMSSRDKKKVLQLIKRKKMGVGFALRQVQKEYAHGGRAQGYGLYRPQADLNLRASKLDKTRQDKDVKDEPGTQPAKYYSGVKKKTKDDRAAHFRKGAKMDDDNPAAYAPAPGDAGAKTKPSKHTKKYKKMFGEDMPISLDSLLNEKIEGLVKKAEKSGIPYGILKQVYNRGMAAWRTGHRPGTTPQQWAFARVNSFVTKSKGTWGGADKDLAAKARGAKKEAIEYPSDRLTQRYKKDTPGQSVKDESLWANIHKKRQRIKQGSGEKMRKKGEKGAPTPAQMQRAKAASEETIQSWYESTETRASYQLRYNDDWWWKLNETHDLMLEKIGASCCDDCLEEKVKIKKVGKEVGFDYKGQFITDPTMDPSGRFEVNPRKYYKLTSRDMKNFKMVEQITPWAVFKEQNFYGEIEEAAEYQGRKVTLNKPMKGDVKKSKVYVKNDKGNVVKVEFGDPNMEIKRDDPARRKSFRARHNCDNPGPKYKARYWSCKFWEKGRTVTSLKKG
tara:strand:- start:22128 stop:24518 length:2391 start_codon:yes stop_codon:yes gene_type:complete